MIFISWLVVKEPNKISAKFSSCMDEILEDMNLTLCYEYRLKEFVDNTGQLNILDNYSQLKERSKAIGYEVSKVVYRGFQCNDKLQVNVACD